MVVLAFAVGIILQDYSDFAFATMVGIIGASFALLALYQWKAPKPWFRKYPFVQSVLIGLVFLMLGASRTYTKNPHHTPNHVIHWHDTLSVNYYRATAISSMESTPNSKRATLEINEAFINNQWVNAVGMLIAYFPKTDTAFQLFYGEELLISGKPRLVPSPSNPHAFDYQSYLNTKGITHQQFLQPATFLKTTKKRGNVLFAASWQARDYFSVQFKKYIPNTKSRAIALALILGVKNELDNTLKDAYAGAGAMHILAVSGLHVGILIGFLGLIFYPLVGHPKGKIIKGILSLLILWAYAFITGLSPSVMRAVTMFSVLAIGEMMNRRGNIYNTLSFSALILLVYNPFMLYQVGFQLSFAAVVGIVWLYPFFQSWFTFRWEIANWAWSITCVSLAAQAATFPIGLFYFHQFPNYFFLSNLAVIPAATVIVCGGIALLIATVFTPLATLVGYALSYFIMKFNSFIQAFNTLPFAVSENVYIDAFTTVLLSIAVVFSGKLFIQKKKKWLVSLILVCCIFSTWSIFRKIENRNRKTLAIYHTPKSVNLSFLNGNQPIILIDSTLANNPSALQYIFKEDLLFRGIQTDAIFHLTNQLPEKMNCYRYSEDFWVFVWQGKSIGWLRSKTKEKPTLTLDYLVVSHNAVFNIEDLEKIAFSELVIDSTNGFKTGQNLMNQAKERELSAHWINQQGAWQVNL